MSAQEAFPKVQAAIAKALEIDDALPDVHASAAFAHVFYDADWDGAKRSLDRALELDPDNARAHATYSFWMMAMGRTAEQLDHARRAQALDPLSPVFATIWAGAFVVTGEYAEAPRLLRNAIELEPDYVYARFFLANTYMGERNYAEAIRSAHEFADNSGNGFASRYSLAVSYAGAGRLEEARAYLDTIPETVPHRLLGEAFLADIAGDRAEAFEWLSRCVENRPGSFMLMVTQPEPAPLLDDPRMDEI